LKKFLLFIVLFITISTEFGCATFHKTPLSNLYWLQGEWRGVGLYLDFPQSWTVILDVENDQFGVRYPTMECSGEWKILHHNRHRATFIEVIWQGRDNCTNNGKIIVTYIDQYHISYSYFSGETGKLEASATLVNTAYRNILRT